MRAISLCVAVAMGVVLSPSLALAERRAPPAKASDPKNAEARALFETGAAAYAKGSYDAAIRAWERSYELSKKPLIFESLANAYERLGDVRKAHDYLARWREVAPRDEWELLDERLKNLTARTKREDELEAQRKEADERARREQEAKTEARVDAVLRRQTGAPLAAYALTATGAAAVGIGVTLDIIAAVRRPASSACATASDGSNVCRSVDVGSIQASNSFALAGDITWIAGVAMTAGGVVWILTKRAPGRDPAPAAAVVVPTFGPHGGGLSVSHAF